MQVVTQLEERFPSDDLTLFQAQPFDADADPVPGLLFALGVIIVVGQVLVEIRLGDGPVLLWDGAEHGLPFYANPAREVVPKAEQRAFFSRLGLMAGSL